MPRDSGRNWRSSPLRTNRSVLIQVLSVASVFCHGFVAPAYPCTVFNITHQGRTFVGANEDWTTDRFYVQVRPAGPGSHGILLFGVDDPEKYPFFGFNDEGLFFDLASVPGAQAPVDGKKETHGNEIYIRMLERCSNAKEATDFLARFNVTGLARHHIMVVDRTGSSAIIEGARDGQVVIWKKGHYQIMTNFSLSGEDDPAMLSSGRYGAAEQMLSKMATPTIKSLRSVLHRTRNDSARYPTVFSSILDVNQLRLYLHQKGDFGKFVVIDMREELQKGQSRRRLSDLFE